MCGHDLYSSGDGTEAPVQRHGSAEVGERHGAEGHPIQRQAVGPGVRLSAVTVRIGFLGAGLIAHYHALQLHACDTPHEIVAVYDPDPGRAEAFGGWGAVALDSPAEVIAASDAVFICTWTSEHLPLVREVVTAGRAVFCEKPLSTDLATARELAAIVAAADVVNMTGLVMRTAPPLLAVREMIHDERSGRVMNIVFRDDQYIPTQGMYASSWRADTSKAGSGSLLEHSIHDLDLIEWLVGPAATVNAHTAHFHGIDGIEDSVSVMMHFAAGHSVLLASVWHDILSRPSQRRIEVFCERAFYVIEGEAIGPVTWQVERSDGNTDSGSLMGAELEAWLEDKGIDLTGAEESFLRAVSASMAGDAGASASPSVGEAIRPHVLADAIYRSAVANGAPVDVTIAPVDLVR